MGIFRRVNRPTYNDQARAQVAMARETMRTTRRPAVAATRPGHLDRRLAPTNQREQTQRPRFPAGNVGFASARPGMALM